MPTMSAWTGVMAGFVASHIFKLIMELYRVREIQRMYGSNGRSLNSEGACPILPNSRVVFSRLHHARISSSRFCPHPATSQYRVNLRSASRREYFPIFAMGINHLQEFPIGADTVALALDQEAASFV
jgi:hypothetical protein